jgi:uncharacterized SAM-binding protein YcdF (DUF218 family)
MLFFKHVAGVLAAPLVLALLVAAAAGVFRLRGRGRIAAWLVALAGAIAWLGSTANIGNMLLRPLEREYASLRDDQPLPAVEWIVVLGSSYRPRGDIPVTAALDADGLTRIVEGVRLARKYRSIRLVVSGGAPEGGRPAQGYAEMARGLGIDGGSLVISDQPLDTDAEAHAIAKLIGSAPFILVTSAYHMPRAVRVMRRAGARPIPAPTGQQVYESVDNVWLEFLPSSAGLRRTEVALHEWLGLAALAFGVN